MDGRSAVVMRLLKGQARNKEQREQNSYLLLRLVAVFFLPLLRRFRFLDCRTVGFITVWKIRLAEILQPH